MHPGTEINDGREMVGFQFLTHGNQCAQLGCEFLKLCLTSPSDPQEGR
jgi:hypothetical protein